MFAADLLQYNTYNGNLAKALFLEFSKLWPTLHARNKLLAIIFGVSCCGESCWIHKDETSINTRHTLNNENCC